MDNPPFVQPQPGAQYKFLQSEADIVLYGGSAGGGKSYGLLLDVMRFFNTDNINAVIFRREREQLSKPGSIWMESQKLYGSLGLRPHLTYFHYRFLPNSYLKFSGLQDKIDWQGAQLDFIGFDELTQFTEDQFWYLIARLRSVSGQIKPYCRATCNPDQGWVFDLLRWWIDEKTGYPIAERSGVIRWFFKDSHDKLAWYDSEKEAIAGILAHKLGKERKCMSLTFIPATLNDNQILLKNDPNYYARLSQLPETQRIQLLEGRWFFKPIGKLFKPDWFKSFVVTPHEPECILITTDTASSTKTANDFSCFQVWYRWEGKIYLIHEVHGRFTAQQQLNLLANLIISYKATYVSIERASTGFHLIDEIVKKTSVLVIEQTRKTDKYQRGYEVQNYVENGYIFLNVNAPYYSHFISEVAAFAPENKNKAAIHDDRVDPFIDAICLLLLQKIGYTLPEPTYNIKRKSMVTRSL